MAGWGYNSWLGLERENSWREEVPSGREGRREGGRKRQRDRGSKAERTKEEREVREEEREESGKENGRDRGSARFLQILAQTSIRFLCYTLSCTALKETHRGTCTVA